MNRLHFAGRARDIFSGEAVKMLLWFCSIVGIPIGMAYMARWFVRNTQLPDGTRGEFRGKPGQIALNIYLSMVVALGIDNVVKYMMRADEWSHVVVSALGLLAAIATQGALYRAQLKWVLCGWTFGQLPENRFAVGTAGYVAWYVSSYLMYFVAWLAIIRGEAWALGLVLLCSLPWLWTAYMRWMCDRIMLAGSRVRFVGKWHSVLWRLPVAGLLACLVVPLPWVFVWMTRWWAGNCEMVGQETMLTKERAY